MRISLREAAAAAPQAVALIVSEGADAARAPATFTFGALWQAVAPLVRWLTMQAAGRRVALVADNRLPTALWLYALLERGLPTVLIHPRLSARERAEQLAEVAPVLLIDESTPLPRGSLLTDPPEPLPRGTEPQFILFTSGTTGRPKGAMLSPAALCASAEASARNLGWRPDDRWLLAMPLAHIGGLSILVRCLLARATVVLRSGAFEVPALVRAIERHRVTLLSLVPTMLTRLLERQPPWLPPPHLRALLLGGAAASPALIERAAARAVPVLTTYGLTETSSQVTTQRYGTPPSPSQGSGPPIDGVELRIRDGLIEVRGPVLFDGYYPPERHGSPLVDGWFSTGDLGYLDEEGRLHVLARRTDLIVSGGENVYPLEVEQALEGCLGVAAACVFGEPDEEWGQRVVAAVVAQGARPPDELLATELASRLARFKHPRQLAWLDGLSYGPSGKLERAATATRARPELRPFPRRPD